MDDFKNAWNNYFNWLCQPEVMELDCKDHITSRVYHTSEVSDISYVKVDLPSLGFYVNSITIRDNPRDPEKLWVQLPKFMAGRRWIAPLEFVSGNPLRRTLIAYALRAYYLEYGSSMELVEFISENLP